MYNAKDISETMSGPRSGTMIIPCECNVVSFLVAYIHVFVNLLRYITDVQ